MTLPALLDAFADDRRTLVDLPFAPYGVAVRTAPYPIGWPSISERIALESRVYRARQARKASAITARVVANACIAFGVSL